MSSTRLMKKKLDYTNDIELGKMDLRTLAKFEYSSAEEQSSESSSEDEETLFLSNNEKIKEKSSSCNPCLTAQFIYDGTEILTETAFLTSTLVTDAFSLNELILVGSGLSYIGLIASLPLAILFAAVEANMHRKHSVYIHTNLDEVVIQKNDEIKNEIPVTSPTWKKRVSELAQPIIHYAGDIYKGTANTVARWKPVINLLDPKLRFLVYGGFGIWNAVGQCQQMKDDFRTSLGLNNRR